MYTPALFATKFGPTLWFWQIMYKNSFKNKFQKATFFSFHLATKVQGHWLKQCL